MFAVERKATVVKSHRGIEVEVGYNTDECQLDTTRPHRVVPFSSEAEAWAFADTFNHLEAYTSF